MIYIVLPAYNEELNLEPLLQRIKSLPSRIGEWQVLVVDDGSRDKTGEVAARWGEKYPVALLSHPVNRGLGSAVTSGLKWASQRALPGDVIVTMDADNTHDPLLIEDMVASIARGADVVIASRYQTGGQEVGLTWQRKILSRGASLFLKTLFMLNGVRDYSSGFRAYRAGLLQQAFQAYGDRLVESRGFDCMAEILLKLRYFRPIFAEVPLVLRYDYKQGGSKMAVVPTIFRYFYMARRAGKPIPSGIQWQRMGEE